MAEATRTAVYTIKIEQSSALRNVEALRKNLEDQKATTRDLVKENRQLIQAERDLEKQISITGGATRKQAEDLEFLRKRRDEVNRQLTESTLKEKALNDQVSKASKDILDNGQKAAEAKMRVVKKQAEEEASAALRSAQEQERIAQEQAREQERIAKYLLSVKLKSLDQEERANAKAKLEELRREQNAAKEKDRLAKKELADREKERKYLYNLRIRSLELEEQAEREAARTSTAQANLGKQFDSFVQNQGRELKSTLSSVALQYVGVGAAIYGVQQVLGDAITTVLEFEKALDSVASLGGEYKAKIDALGDAAIDLGVKFGIGATDSVRAIEALAKAGVSAADILGGGLEGALTLAASGELEVAEAAEIASGAMTQFALGGESVSHIADLLAAGANKAQGGVGDLGAALKQSGLVAAQYGISLEETIGTLSAFASNALTGSDSGTSFKTMLQSLVPRSAEAAAEMERLGLKFFDAQGKFIGLEGVAGQLREGLQDLTQEQQASALKTIFGSDAVRAATVLYQQGAEGVAEWTTAVNESGFAAEVAEEKLNNLSGDVDKLGSAWDRTVLSIENGNGLISQSLRSITQQVTGFLGILSGSATTFDKLSASGLGFLTQDQRDAVKKTADEFDRINKEGANFTLITEKGRKVVNLQTESLDNLRFAINDAREKEKAFAEQGKSTQAAEFAKRASMLQRIVTARESIAVARGQVQSDKEVTVQTIAEADAIRTVSAAREELNAKLDQAKASRDGLAASDTAGIAAANKEIDAIEAQINALDGKNKKTKESADVVKGSIADFEQQIKKLRDSQATATDSAQFAAYQAQIDGLQESIDKINGTTVDLPDLKDIQFDQSANAPEQPAPISPDDLTDLGLNPNSAELLQLNYDQLLAIQEDYNLKRLQNSIDVNDQLFALEKQWNSGKIQSLEEYQSQRKAILDRAAQEEREREIRGAEEVLAATTQLANSLIAVQASRTANQVAEIDKRIEAERSAGRDTAQLEKEKKDIQTKAAREAFEIQRQLALAQLAIDLAKSISSLTSASAGNPTNAVTYGAAGAAQYAAGIIQILASIAQATALLNQKAPGFAGGGDIDKPSGTVTKAWGAPIKRASGDNVLVRTKYGAVALKTGEKVLNEDQQEALERLAGRGIWSAIGLPGYARNQLETARAFRQAWHGQGLAMGGTVGIVTPRPSPEAVVQNNVASQLAEFAATPIYVAWTDYKRQERSAEFRDTRNTLS